MHVPYHLLATACSHDPLSTEGLAPEKTHGRTLHSHPLRTDMLPHQSRPSRMTIGLEWKSWFGQSRSLEGVAIGEKGTADTPL